MTHLLVWGAAGDGQHGTGATDNAASPRPLPFFADARLSLAALAVGRHHVLALVDRGAERGLLYSWGSNDHGQLGHCGRRLRPSPLAALDATSVVAIACGESHSLAVDVLGRLFAWGSNSHGQLGIPSPSAPPPPSTLPQPSSPQPSSFAKPKLVPFPGSPTASRVRITQIAAGHRHSLALDSLGNLWSFGDASNGRLGRPVVHTSASCSHCSVESPAERPGCIRSLFGLPIRKMSCGGSHSAVITVCGSVFVWGIQPVWSARPRTPARHVSAGTRAHDAGSGRRRCGLRRGPHRHCHGLRVPVCVWGWLLWRAWPWQQCTRRSADAGPGATRVHSRIGCLRAAPYDCAACSTAAALFGGRPAASDVVRVFGLNSSGQLGLGSFTSASVPVRLHLPMQGMVVVSGHSDTCFAMPSPPLPSPSSLPQSGTVASIFSSLASLNGAFLELPFSKPALSVHPFIDFPAVHAVFGTQSPSTPTDTTTDADSDVLVPLISRLVSSIRHVHSSHPEALRAVFLVLAIPALHSAGDLSKAMLHVVTDLFGALSQLSDSQWKQLGTWWRSAAAPVSTSTSTSTSTPASTSAVHLKTHFEQTILLAHRVITNHVKTVPNSTLQHILPTVQVLDRLWAINNLSWTLDHSGIGCVKSARIFPPATPPPPPPPRSAANYSSSSASSTSMAPASRPVLAPGPSPVTLTRPRIFQNDALSMAFDAVAGYMSLFMDGSGHVHTTATTTATMTAATTTASDNSRMHVARLPFLFNVNAKTALLETDFQRQMFEAQTQSLLSALQTRLFGVAENGGLAESGGGGGVGHQPYVCIHVRRSHVVLDTACELSEKRLGSLKKPLKVKFVGEDGVDEGGVGVEFFTLFWEAAVGTMDVFEVLDDADGDGGADGDGDAYGAVEPAGDGESGKGLRSMYVWFNPAASASPSQATSEMYNLVGRVLGLSLYNGSPCPVSFPPIFFRQLVGEPADTSRLADMMADLRVFQPRVAQSLQQLLDYPGSDVQDVFGLDFTVTCRASGGKRPTQVIELQPNGADIPVTADNKAEYVRLFVKWRLYDSVSHAMAMLRKGFDEIVRSGGHVFESFTSADVGHLMAGSQHFDFRDLEKGALYREPYHARHPVIRRFWTVVHQLPADLQRRFLRFVTGTERVPPVLGLKGVGLCIQQSGVDESASSGDGGRGDDEGDEELVEGDDEAEGEGQEAGSRKRKRGRDDGEGGDADAAERNGEEGVEQHGQQQQRDKRQRTEDGGHGAWTGRSRRAGQRRRGLMRLPSAHTCSHVLDLPPYSSAADLRERLVFAMANADGFYLA
ncbi:hypothetical protein BC831DRAFT_454825 [Entophlyctis helioformis]|nr:hypothetical protein BC831DRAFT_454825 [Entophlyctis helioformis]